MKGPASLITFLASAATLSVTNQPTYGTSPTMEFQEELETEQRYYLNTFRRLADKEVTFQKFPYVVWGWQCPDKEHIFSVDELSALNGITLEEYMKRYVKAMMYINRGIIMNFEGKSYDFTTHETMKPTYSCLSAMDGVYAGVKWNFIDEETMRRDVLQPLRDELLVLRREEEKRS